MSIKIIFLSIFFALFTGFYFYSLFKYYTELEKEAKKSVESYNTYYGTDFSYLQFAKIERHNPGWLSYGCIKQKQLLDEFGEELLFRECI